MSVKKFFEDNYNLNIHEIKLDSCFKNQDDIGEVFIEHVKSEQFVMQNGVMQKCSVTENSGFGARLVSGESIQFISRSDISSNTINNSLISLKTNSNNVAKKHSNIKKEYTKSNISLNLYPFNGGMNFSKEIDLLTDIDTYLKNCNYVTKRTISLSITEQHVLILMPDGTYLEDMRPLNKLNISVIINKNKRDEIGTSGFGGRSSVSEIISKWRMTADDAIRQGVVNTMSIDAPTGEMPVVLSSGWTGIILHEAIGHGLEADFNRKGVSAFSKLMGQVVASEKVTILDDGTIPGKRGSINFDDEGTKSEKTILVENGVLKSYMFDKQNAKLMGKVSTGNGRREDFASIPYPRMTNTYMLAGNESKEEMIESIKHGIYAVSFSGGQVDIISGKFVFSASEAYLIENGKVTKPIKGASLVGDGPSILKRVSMVGNDFSLDPGIGTCGKNGQMVPVCVGEPSIKLDSITVGGTM